MKTVLITGSSTGIGLETARIFSQHGWNVAATMRHPEKDSMLSHLPGVKLYRLDVNEEASIRDAIAQTLKDFDSLDVVVNNAGYAAVGPFEAASEEQIRQQFDTNVFGVMKVIRETLPYFREKKQGVIVNVSTVGGLLTFPLYSLYHATKWALEGFSESLHYELKDFNIRIKLVEPGPVKTDFYDRSEVVLEKEGLTDYEDFTTRLRKIYKKKGLKGAQPQGIAETIFKAASDGSEQLRYPCGNKEVKPLLFLRRILPFRAFAYLMRKAAGI